MLSQVSRALRPWHAPQSLRLYPKCVRDLSTSASSSVLREDQRQLAAALTECLSSSAPEAAASGLIEGLSNQHRSILLQALGSDATKTPESYVNKLFEEADTRGPFQQLDK